jgi:hypothetical protein
MNVTVCMIVCVCVCVCVSVSAHNYKAGAFTDHQFGKQLIPPMGILCCRTKNGDITRASIPVSALLLCISSEHPEDAYLCGMWIRG